MNTPRSSIRLVLMCIAGLTAGCSTHKPQSPPTATPLPEQPRAASTPSPSAPALRSNPQRDAYFGEQHVHTAYSLDAYIGGTRLTPDAAYRFAKGQEVEVSGQKFRLHRALDWAAVTDHAEYIGEMYSALTAGAPGYDQELMKELRALNSIEEREAWFLKYVVKSNRSGTPQHPPFFAGAQTVKSAWQEILAAAEAHYEPGKFTTIPAFEWSAAPNGGNLHRNVFFRDMHVPEAPMSYIDIHREEGLWAWMAELEKQGMHVLAIPHNSNASKGMMFGDVDSAGRPFDRAYAETRSRHEPAIEIMQIKGNSEVHRAFWSADEFADFENADTIQDYSQRTFAKQDFVREGVIKGLAYRKALGANPFKYGFVGGTDSHNGTPSNTSEDNFQAGSHGAADATVERRRSGEVGGWIKGRDLNPGALSGVWAESNTREALWDALRRRETFATSGTRIKLRFFAGWNYADDVLADKALLQTAYAGGVPMGGDLTAAPAGKAPKFIVSALKDPDGANLDRLQIIKGWVDTAGKTHEKIYDVAWSDQRKPSGGHLPAVGNTVDPKSAQYANTIGAAALSTVWRDPDFDAALHALYYVRVIEIPTPRWSTYDAVRAGLPLLKDVPVTIQERAWSSPIWYSPRE
jgi:hypothetical protein